MVPSTWQGLCQYWMEFIIMYYLTLFDERELILAKFSQKKVWELCQKNRSISQTKEELGKQVWGQHHSSSKDLGSWDPPESFKEAALGMNHYRGWVMCPLLGQKRVKPLDWQGHQAWIWWVGLKTKLSVDTKIKMGVNSGQGKQWMPMIFDISIPLGTPVWVGVYVAVNDPCKDPVILSFPCFFLPVTCAVRTVRGQP